MGAVHMYDKDKYKCNIKTNQHSTVKIIQNKLTFPQPVVY